MIDYTKYSEERLIDIYNAVNKELTLNSKESAKVAVSNKPQKSILLAKFKAERTFLINCVDKIKPLISSYLNEEKAAENARIASNYAELISHINYKAFLLIQKKLEKDLGIS